LFSMKANTKNLTIFSEDYFFNDARQNQNIWVREGIDHWVQQFPEKSHPICNDSDSGWRIVDAPCSFKPLWYPQQSYSEHQAPFLKPRDTDCAKFCTLLSCIQKPGAYRFTKKHGWLEVSREVTLIKPPHWQLRKTEQG
jgi:hypothetical protein